MLGGMKERWRKNIEPAAFPPGCPIPLGLGIGRLEGSDACLVALDRYVQDNPSTDALHSMWRPCIIGF
jgi:hypothetical protein